ncbi:MAG: flagellar basal body rod protein FlgC [Rhodospirillaceae bacterium]|nr:flagellar basal body rod protein FlgC [Rhodospirillaceae bacterium]
MDDLKISSEIAAKGMKAQATRLRVISENLANADSTAEAPGGEPYRRKLVTFRNQLDKAIGADTVMVKKIFNDQTKLPSKYDPSHPGANAQGYVLTPNVNPLIEMMDMREAQRSYEANMNVISTSRSMVAKTLELLK